MTVLVGIAGPNDRACAAQPEDLAGAEPFFEVWDEEVPVMGHLAVATDGTVLLFTEQREKGAVEVKRSENGGKTWGHPIEVGKRVKIDADMSDDDDDAEDASKVLGDS